MEKISKLVLGLPNGMSVSILASHSRAIRYIIIIIIIFKQSQLRAVLLITTHDDTS